LPYLIPSFWRATIIALMVVFIELLVIAIIPNRYMETPLLRAAFQVVLGGGLVLAAGILIGGAQRVSTQIRDVPWDRFIAQIRK